MERRKCEDCEYYDDERCYFNPPQFAGSHIDPEQPNVHENSYCSNWEPRWHDNLMLKEAWEQFMMVHKIITSGDGDI